MQGYSEEASTPVFIMPETPCSTKTSKDGRTASRSPVSCLALYQRWRRLLWSNGSDTLEKTFEAVWMSFHMPRHKSGPPGSGIFARDGFVSYVFTVTYCMERQPERDPFRQWNEFCGC